MSCSRVLYDGDGDGDVLFFVYLFRRGESYLDVIARLEPIIIEMERHKCVSVSPSSSSSASLTAVLFPCVICREPLLIIAHQGILRIIYAFYMGKSRAEAPYMSIPLNTVVEITPSAFSCKVEVLRLQLLQLLQNYHY